LFLVILLFLFFISLRIIFFVNILLIMEQISILLIFF
jgi:hypothetical protein